MRLLLVSLIYLFSTSCFFESEDQNYIRIHDPTTIRKFGEYYMVYSTTGGGDDTGIKTRYLALGSARWEEIIGPNGLKNFTQTTWRNFGLQTCHSRIKW